MSGQIDKNLLQIYQTMVKIRSFEEEIARRWPEQQMRSPPHFYTGQEAIASSVCQTLGKEDQVIGNYRGHGYFLAKGGDPKAFIAEMYCKVTGANQGKGGSMLLSSPTVGYMGSSALVGGGIPIATGLALGAKMQKSKRVVVCFFGDAAIEEGVFYESMNFASLKKLPIIYICENNLYAVTTYIKNRQARPDNITKRVLTYGLPAVQIDGNDPETIYQKTLTAVVRVREGQGPSFIECLTYRWHEHVGEKIDTNYGLRTPQELECWMKKDPIDNLEKKLIKRKILTKQKIFQIKNQINKQVAEAFKFAINSPLPNRKDLLTNVYP